MFILLKFSMLDKNGKGGTGFLGIGIYLKFTRAGLGSDCGCPSEVYEVEAWALLWKYCIGKTLQNWDLVEAN